MFYHALIRYSLSLPSINRQSRYRANCILFTWSWYRWLACQFDGLFSFVETLTPHHIIIVINISKLRGCGCLSLDTRAPDIQNNFWQNKVPSPRKCPIIFSLIAHSGSDVNAMGGDGERLVPKPIDNPNFLIISNGSWAFLSFLLCDYTSYDYEWLFEIVFYGVSLVEN